MPWQQYSADVALEIDPETGELWYEEVIITVPRQSGKTTLILAILVWRCIVMALRLGPQTCTYIAQSGKMARRKLEREFARLMRSARSLREVPQLSRQRPMSDDEWKLSMNNGSEHILFGTDSYLQIEAPTDTGSHGDVLDMPVIDEAFSREDDLVEQATDAATVTRRSPQSWVISTAGNERSIFLARKVIAGRKAADDPKSRTCYLEWSVPDEESFDDPDVWARYLPALGHTITVARLLARLDKATRNPEEVDEEGFEPGVAGFKRGYLNQWPKFPTFGNEGAGLVPMVLWDGMLLDADSTIASHHTWALAVSPDLKWATIGLAGRRNDGLLHVEWMYRTDPDEGREGTAWIVPTVVAAYATKKIPIRIHKSGTESSWISLLREQGVEVEEVSTGELAQATVQFVTACNSGDLRHRLQPELGMALRQATVSTAKYGQSVWDTRTSADLSPLVAVTVALGGVPAEQPVDPVSQIW